MASPVVDTRVHRVPFRFQRRLDGELQRRIVFH